MKEFVDFLCGLAKIVKKLVTKKRFWKINAFQPKIKAIKGKTRKFYFGLNANLGGLKKLEKPSVFDPRGQAMLTLTGNI